MPEISDNTLIDNQIASSEGYPGIESVQEYFQQSKPEFKWNSKDNLLVCLQFSIYQPFPERCFQQFIIEWQGKAFVKTSEIEEEELEIDKDEGLPDFMKPNWVKTFDKQAKVEEQRFIWANGIYFEQKANEPKYQIEIEKVENDRQVIVRCSGKSPEARAGFESVIGWFKSQNLNVEVHVICTCDLCRKNDLKSAHQIQYRDLENLKRRFEPKVQCYHSGVMKRLNDISNVELPSYRSVIINAPSDKYFCDVAIKSLFPKSTIITEPFYRDKIKGGDDFKQEFERKVSNADLIIILVSPDLIGKDDEGDSKEYELAREMVDLAINEMLQEKKALVAAIEIKEYHAWGKVSPYDHEDIEKFFKEKEEDFNPNDWAKISSSLEIKIEKWLKTKVRQND